MATRWRGLLLIGLFVATWLGCDSAEESTRLPANHAGATTDAGRAGSTAGGGQSGNAGMFGTGALAGTPVNTGGTSGLAGRGGAAGASAAPEEWTCNYFAYGDGKCDCGCGAPDRDCTLLDAEHCEVCDGVGSCNLAECPGRIDPDDVTKCLPPAEGWTCPAPMYGDGTSCDCGCGVEDEDCANTDAASCDNCAATGSCAHGPCPSALVADDNTRCEIPTRWTCDRATYGDGTCNCGCGVVDVDCPDAAIESCQVCDSSSCSLVGCAVLPEDNAHCVDPPEEWGCSPRLYHDGSRCDCGCGAVDPDCESSDREACDTCDVPGSCSATPCPGIITEQANSDCDQPDPPPEWTCTFLAYADGATCDCGCGAPDPDCRSDDLATCVRCLACGGKGVCENLIDPEDTTHCAPPMDGWTCSPEAYRDYICDCGCGIPDVFCQGLELLYVCGNYPVEGCSGGQKLHIDPNHNALCVISVPEDWTCDRSFYHDGICDCGCGALDLDCPSNDAADCEYCEGEGSCSTTECPGTIAPDDTAHCAN